ncbi:MAG: hypothetical protein IPN85_02960 [Flavobacteriales bacterium]|nr:hypothetical protein [Flavobacteriales bacterium]MBL0034203.1 hypothetical protein [Flavobacteriales bacterium]
MQELEDLPWFPAKLRDYQTEHIGFLATRMPVYDVFLAYLRRNAPRRGPQVDLCSGSGEPAVTLYRRGGFFTDLTLTDRYPQWGYSAPEGVIYDPRPLNARSLQPVEGTCYTMFNAFHHFTKGEQGRFIAKFRTAGVEAFFVELLEPTVLCMLKVLFATTFGVLLLAPFVKPFSLGRLFFTYVVPVNVLTITWDGVISVLRARTAEQYRSQFEALGADVQVHRLPGPWLPITVIHVPAS